MSNLDTFMTVLEEELRKNIERSPGSYSPEARDMSVAIPKYRAAILAGQMSKEGPAMKATCKRLKIRNTYEAIKSYVTKDSPKSVTVTLDVHCSPEAVDRLLKNPPKELAGFKVLGIEKVED